MSFKFPRGQRVNVCSDCKGNGYDTALPYAIALILPDAGKASGYHKMALSGTGQGQSMGLLPDTQNCGLRMRQVCRERFSRHRLQRKSLVNDPGMHHGTCVTHVPWCMSGSLTRCGWENAPGIPAHAPPAILRIWQEAHNPLGGHKRHGRLNTGMADKKYE